MHLLDSDTLSHLWANNERVIDRLRRCEDIEIGTTSISKCEVLRTRCENLLKASSTTDLLRAQQLLDRSEIRLSELLIVPFDAEAAKQLVHLERSRKLKKIGRADLIISSIALAYDATLVTRNVKHFRQVPYLRVENWVD